MVVDANSNGRGTGAVPFETPMCREMDTKKVARNQWGLTYIIPKIMVILTNGIFYHFRK